MKKLSLFSLFGLAGLLAFFVTPIYAQDVEDAVDAVDAVVLQAEEDFNNGIDEIWNTLEAAGDEVVDTVEDVAEEIEDIPSVFEDEEIVNAFEGLNMDDKDAYWLIGLFAGLWIAAWLIGLVWLVLVIIAMWKIFEKAWEAGWKAIIPIYNVYILYKIVGMKNWFWYSILVPVILWIIAGFLENSSANIAEILSTIWVLFSSIVSIVATFKLPRKFGWGVFTSILYVLFTGICILILGFGNYKYEGKENDSTVVEA